MTDKTDRVDQKIGLEDEYDQTPLPYLSYQMYDLAADPSEVVREPGSPRLYSVHRAGASMSSGALRVTLEGPMRKRDGGRGQHSRILVVDLGHQQPDWLTFLIRDARRRLLVTSPGGEQ